MHAQDVCLSHALSTKKSFIWAISKDTKFAICNAYCQSISCRGKTTKTSYTVYHIKGMHMELQSEYLEKCDEETKEKASTLSTRQASSDKTHKRIIDYLPNIFIPG